jgi:hypothetical protein
MSDDPRPQAPSPSVTPGSGKRRWPRHRSRR